MFLIIGIPSIRLSEPVVDLSQRNIFVVILQACLRRQEYKRDPNEKKRDQFWGQETNFERSRFSSGSSSKQVLRTLGDTFFAAEGVCVCVYVCLCAWCLRISKGRAGRDSGRNSHPGYQPHHACSSSAVWPSLFTLLSLTLLSYT